MRIKRILASGIAVLALGGTLAACGDDSDDDKSSEENSSQTTEENATEDDAEPPVTEDDAEPPVTEDDAPATSAYSADAAVMVDGEPLAGLDTSTIRCVKQGGKISIGSADADASLGLVMTDEATPQVESLGIMVDGITLAVSQAGGSALGSAEVAVDGDTYTVTGTAAGTDTDDPTAVLEKEFEIIVTC